MARVRKRSGHWQARWLDHNAERSETRRTWTKAQALSYAEEMEAKARRTPWTAPSQVPTLAEFIDIQMVGRQGIEESTRYRERSAWKRVKARFGPYEINTVRPSEIQEWVDELIAEGLKPSTVRDLYGLARHTFNSALRDEIIDRTPCVGIRLPRRTKTARPATIAEVGAISGAIDDRYGVVPLFLAAMGTRIGETLGIRVSDLVEVPKPSVVLQRGISVDGQGRVIVKDRLKTEGSIRRVTIPRWLWEELQSHIKTQGLRPDDFLFPAPLGGKMDPRRFRARFWRPAAEDAGCPEVTPHKLRHLQASLLIAENRPRTEITARLGWSSPRVLDSVYSHFLGEDDSGAADVVPDMRPGKAAG